MVAERRELEAEPVELWQLEERWAQASREEAVSRERWMPSGLEVAAERRGAESEPWPFWEPHSKSQDSPERWIHVAELHLHPGGNAV